MTIVSAIRVGHIIRTDGDEYFVHGNMKVRGRYLYICTNKTGRKVTIGREDVMQAQMDGEAVVVAV